MGKLKNVPQMLKSVTDNFSANTVLAALHPVITALIGEKKKRKSNVSSKYNPQKSY